MQNDRTLPPGQRRVKGFPRFGAHLWRPAPAVPVNPVIEPAEPKVPVCLQGGKPAFVRVP